MNEDEDDESAVRDTQHHRRVSVYWLSPASCQTESFTGRNRCTTLNVV